jgi:hypothetical protein
MARRPQHGGRASPSVSGENAQICPGVGRGTFIASLAVRILEG